VTLYYFFQGKKKNNSVGSGHNICETTRRSFDRKLKTTMTMTTGILASQENTK